MSGNQPVEPVQRDEPLRVTMERFLDPAVSPLFGDFHGLPPLLFQVGSSEMLLDDATRAAAKARAAAAWGFATARMQEAVQGTPGFATLCHDDRPLAHGELVDVDGHIGLQITRLEIGR